jgi:hypothetical protein
MWCVGRLSPEDTEVFRSAFNNRMQARLSEPISEHGDGDCASGPFRKPPDDDDNHFKDYKFQDIREFIHDMAEQRGVKIPGIESAELDVDLDYADESDVVVDYDDPSPTPLLLEGKASQVERSEEIPSPNDNDNAVTSAQSSLRESPSPDSETGSDASSSAQKPLSLDNETNATANIPIVEQLSLHNEPLSTATAFPKEQPSLESKTVSIASTPIPEPSTLNSPDGTQAKAFLFTSVTVCPCKWNFKYFKSP